ncbi:MAG TPA: type II toxin-antitoxin system VapC family toxin [Solirubrobacteraceae bacterium]|nr:type II toxin-antitoxin system VapC family toxin [Solirubrobacteraceae bacterium]
MILLDTNVLSELVRPQPDRGVLDWLDVLDANEVATSAITVAELLYGVARLPEGRRKQQLRAAIGELIDKDMAGRVHSFDALAARHCADILDKRERMGRPMSAADAQIAAICRTLAATLATRNTSDFEDAGIELLNPWRTG